MSVEYPSDEEYECTIDHRAELGLPVEYRFHAVFEGQTIWAFNDNGAVRCAYRRIFNIVVQEQHVYRFSGANVGVRIDCEVWCPELPEISDVSTARHHSIADALSSVKSLIATRFVETFGHHARLVIRTAIADE